MQQLEKLGITSYEVKTVNASGRGLETHIAFYNNSVILGFSKKKSEGHELSTVLQEILPKGSNLRWDDRVLNTQHWEREVLEYKQGTPRLVIDHSKENSLGVTHVLQAFSKIGLPLNNPDELKEMLQVHGNDPVYKGLTKEIIDQAAKPQKNPEQQQGCVSIDGTLALFEEETISYEKKCASGGHSNQDYSSGSVPSKSSGMFMIIAGLLILGYLAFDVFGPKALLFATLVNLSIHAAIPILIFSGLALIAVTCVLLGLKLQQQARTYRKIAPVASSPPQGPVSQVSASLRNFGIASYQVIALHDTPGAGADSKTLVFFYNSKGELVKWDEGLQDFMGALFTNASLQQPEAPTSEIQGGRDVQLDEEQKTIKEYKMPEGTYRLWINTKTDGANARQEKPNPTLVNVLDILKDQGITLKNPDYLEKLNKKNQEFVTGIGGWITNADYDGYLNAYKELTPEKIQQAANVRQYSENSPLRSDFLGGGPEQAPPSFQPPPLSFQPLPGHSSESWNLIEETPPIPPR